MPNSAKQKALEAELSIELLSESDSISEELLEKIRELDLPTRLSLLEREVFYNKKLLLHINKKLEEHEDQNATYREYLADKMTEEKAKRDFWRDIAQKATSAGILGTVGLIGSALIYAVKTFFKEL